MNAPLIGSLQNASLHALLLIVSKTLARLGYGDIQILDRRLPRQRSRYGGHELRCYTLVGDAPTQVIVKIVRQPVRVRMLDELAGAVKRRGADMGVIITPFHLTRNVPAALKQFRSPRLVAYDGERLARLMREHRIGVRLNDSVDYEFFGGLELFSGQVNEFIGSNRL